jgi:hypothetical protein
MLSRNTTKHITKVRVSRKRVKDAGAAFSLSNHPSITIRDFTKMLHEDPSNKARRKVGRKYKPRP